MNLLPPRYVWLLTLCFALGVSGCGGVNCPFTRPACCENALFGCGPFDLPQGCSCSDYFSRSFSGVPKSQFTAAIPSSRQIFDSTWRVSLEKRSGDCSYLSNSFQTTLLVRSQGRRLLVRAPGYSRLRGSRTSRSMKVSGKRQISFPRCAIKLDASISLTSSSQGTAQGAIEITCITPALSCSATFSGVARKI